MKKLIVILIVSSLSLSLASGQLACGEPLKINDGWKFIKGDPKEASSPIMTTPAGRHWTFRTTGASKGLTAPPWPAPPDTCRAELPGTAKNRNSGPK